MRITLLHNPKAGDGGSPEAELTATLERAGHRVTARSVKESGFAPLPDEAPELVVVSGGDGTVAKTAAAWAGRGVPLAIHPAGTANNIARTFSLPEEPRALLEVLAAAKRAPLDLGVARGPWGERLFVEAAGLGLFPRMLAQRARDKTLDEEDAVDRHGSIEGGLRLMEELLADFSGHGVDLTVDGEDMSGSYLMIEVMNIRSIGPDLELSPEARPDDGRLDLVLVRGDQRDELAACLAGREDPLRAGIFPARRAREIFLSCSGAEFHMDDCVWPHPQPGGPDLTVEVPIEIGVRAAAIELLVP